MFPSRLKLQNVKKIAALRAGALGDFIVALPAFEALHAAYPSAEIVLLGRPWQKDFVAKGRTCIDRVIVIPVKKGLRIEPGHTGEYGSEEEPAFFEAMRQEAFDIVLNFQGNGLAANPFLKQFHARVTAGPVPNGDQPEKPDRYYEFFYYQSEVLRYLDTATLVGATPVVLEPSVNVLAQDMNEIKELLSVLGDQPFVVLHPVATDIRRMWPVHNYPSLVKELKQRNVTIVFTGSAADEPVIERIIANTQEPVINTCGRFGLGGLTALLSKAVLVIAADTGPLHLARAVNTPTVGIHWAPNLINWGPLSRIKHKAVISWNLACPLCGIIPNDPYPFEPGTHCQHEVSFVQDVTVEQVLQAADTLLNEREANIAINKIKTYD